MKSIKLNSTNSLSRHRGEAGELGQGRFFDRALRTVKECTETVEYIHLNPVRRGLVRFGEASAAMEVVESYAEYAGVSPVEQERRCGLIIDRAQLPSDENARI